MAFSYSNNNLSNKFKNTADNGYTQLSQLMDVGAWNKPFVFDIPYTSSLAPAKNNTVGIAERGMLHAFDYSGKHFYCVDSSKGWQESPYALKSDLAASQSNPYVVTLQNAINSSLFSSAQYRSRRTEGGTGAAAYGFENVGVNSGALYLDPSDYKLHFINYDGKKFVINWTAEN